MDARQLRHRAEYGVFCTIIFLIQALPLSTAERVTDALAWIVHRLPGKINRRAVAEENLRNAFGGLSDTQIDEIILGMWQHLFRMVFEIAHIRRRLRLETTPLILDFFQREECVQAVMSGRNVIFLGGHFGNWKSPSTHSVTSDSRWVLLLAIWTIPGCTNGFSITGSPAATG